MTTSEPIIDVSQDWLQACSVQEHLMRAPAGTRSGLDYAASCRQLRALGGDCYDFTALADGRLAMLIGDASGKGVAAALMMSGVQASLRTASLFTGDNLPALMRAANLQVCYSSLANRFATLFCALLDPAARTLRSINAGHNPPALLHADGSVDWLEPNGGPIGLFPDAVWQESTVRLCPGDTVLLYTDGVVEASDPSGREWGAEGLVLAARSALACQPGSAAEIVRSVLNAMDAFCCGNPNDDATLAVVCVP
jgi:sigma-B regulation protein RsbU (phosphoserine phosphatase)